MAKKLMSFKTKGMNRDLSVSAFNPEFSFENKNLRLNTTDSNTLLSWVNEKGTERITTSEGKYIILEGIPIGTAVINSKLVVFTTKNKEDNEIISGNNDFIYILAFNDDSQIMTYKQFFNGNLNFSTKYPLETLVSYEAEHIQKIYWTDNRNQPRLANIASDKELNDYSFDFVPNYSGGNIKVEKDTAGGGLFAPGVIQYAFTYINKYKQQTNIVDVSPLFYSSFSDRAASPEEKVNNSFKITINNADSDYDFIRLYSIQRTSFNSDVHVKLLNDIPISSFIKTEYTDNDKWEENVPLNLIYTKGSYPNYTLPVDVSIAKILNVTATDGTLESVVQGAKGPYVNTKIFEFRVYIDDDEEGISFLTLQELINGLAKDSLYSGGGQDYIVSDYCADIVVTPELLSYIQDKAQDIKNYHTLSWSFIIDNEKVTLTEGGSIMYDFVNSSWYIVDDISNNTQSVTTKKKVFEKIETIENGAVFTDNGNVGTTIDPYELLFVGGREIIAGTMKDKDSTLFLGNYRHLNIATELQQKFNDIRDKKTTVNKVSFATDSSIKQLVQNDISGIYSNTNQLKWNSSDITTFKGGDTYRFGIQFQKNNGEWLSPVFINDVKNPYYPKTTANDGKESCSILLPFAKAEINLQELGITEAEYKKYKNIRPVIVYPSISDREVLCQGVLNPTVFNALDRIDKMPYAQASWYFRPYTSDTNGDRTGGIDKIADVTSGALSSSSDLTIEPEYFKNKTIDAYVCIVKIDAGSTETNDDGEEEDYITAFLKRGEVKAFTHSYERDPSGYIHEDHPDVDITSFWGAIVVASNETSTTLALLGSYRFPPQQDSNIHTDEDGWTRDRSYVYDGCQYLATSNYVKFPIYNDMKTIHNTLLYYTNPKEEASLNTYYFRFYVTDWYFTQPDMWYEIAFKSQEVVTSDILDSIGGTTLNYAHYSHVFNRTEASLYGDSATIRRKIEIQNAENLYDTPFSSYNKLKNDCNGDFFIDHSIVTLNSPDIEWNNEVQMYDTSELKLRIIGAIPITANVSSHKITTKSAMLELSHSIGSDKEDTSTYKFGVGELNNNVINYNSLQALNSKRLVSEYLWNDSIVAKKEDAEDKIKTLAFTRDFLIHPWHRTGSLNNDWRNDNASSLLNTKKESNALYSMYTDYLSTEDIQKFEDTSVAVHLTENDNIINYRLKKQNSTTSEINYYPNIDKVLYNKNQYAIYPFTTSEAKDVSSPVLMRYKSTSHAVISFNASEEGIPILPSVERTINGESEILGNYTNNSENTNTFWGDTGVSFTQNTIESTNLKALDYDFLWLGELYKDVAEPYGGKSDSVLRLHNWQIGGSSVPLEGGKATVYWTEGDTYYQRYDCLKTYPYTNEDTNQLVEILSFMCETHVNIDGRYDKNRGLFDNNYVNTTNFNKLNPVYSQPNNYFTYRMLDTETSSSTVYPNQITWSKTKTSGSDVDLWTNITLANTLELDGDKGSISKLDKLNDQLLCFQDNGISHILYNERVQISTAEGVPIELANSDKVQGKKYISDTIGCSNKWSIVNTPGGIYFMDSNDKSIYLYNGELTNISLKGGMNSWCKQRIKAGSIKWNPDEFKTFVSYYDSINQDVMFIDSSTALSWNENFGTFTSFYDYGDTPYFNNLQDVGIWIRKDGSIWRHQAGNYCEFFDDYKPFWMTLIGNVEPTTDKTFTNLEFRATVEGEGNYNPITDKFTPTLPFSSLETWNDYQHGYTDLSFKLSAGGFKHHDRDMSSSLKRKFRMWRCDIPRNNAELDKDRKLGSQYLYSKDSELGISRYIKKPLDRMRNPWLYLKLCNTAINQSKVEIHDIMMTYFN